MKSYKLYNKKEEKKSFKEKMQEILKYKRVRYFGIAVMLLIFTIALNIAFSSFMYRDTTAVANIKVAGMEYGMTIDSNPTRIVKGNANDVTIVEVEITAANKYASKYELIYKVCTTSSCSAYQAIPNDFEVMYSMETEDSVTGEIGTTGTKTITIAIINDTASDVWIELGINAGYAHNTLALEELIINQYGEATIANKCGNTIGVPENIFNPIEVGPGVYAKLEPNGDMRLYGVGSVNDGDLGFGIRTVFTSILSNYIGGGSEAVNFLVLAEFLSPGTIQDMFDNVGYNPDNLPTPEEFKSVIAQLLNVNIDEAPEYTESEITFLFCQMAFMSEFSNEYRSEINDAMSDTNIGVWGLIEALVPEMDFNGHLIVEEGITKIGISNFYIGTAPAMGSKAKITSVSLPNSLSEIGASAFHNNDLSALTIPANVITIGNNAFNINYNLTSVTVLGSNPQRFNANWNNIFSVPRPPMP